MRESKGLGNLECTIPFKSVLFVKVKVFLFTLPLSFTDTSRSKRHQESEGVEYHFISKNLFEADIQNNK